MGYRIAVAGATGTIGREILQILAERDFPADEVVALASSRSIGAEVSFGEDQVLRVHDLDRFDFKRIDIAFFAPGARISEVQAPRAAKAGAVVIDSSDAFSLEPDVPLVVPEVNPEALGRYRKRNIIASPSGVSIPLVVALKPLH